MFNIVRVLTSLLLFFICQPTMAGTATGTLSVTANVGGGGTGQCILGGVRNMIFPSYSPLNSNPDDATGSVTVNCTANLPYDIGINQGLGVGATEEQRRVTKIGGKQELNYGLFQDTHHVHSYGTLIGQNTLRQLGTGSPQVITIYGEIPINQQVEVGSYADTVTIFINF